MSQKRGNKKSRTKRWLRGVLNRTEEERSDIRDRTTLKAFSRPHNPRTFKGTTFIGRNDPCYCGNVYSGVFLKDSNGEDTLVEKPVKFKDCCMRKHISLREGEMTPALAEKQKKEQAYFAKHRRVV